MIPVTPAKEPDDFDSKVRQKGLSAINEMLGKPPLISRRGPRRKKIADRPEEIPPDAFEPFWRDALDDMLDAYERRCAYLALYIEYGTGNPTVDHWIPKSRAWNLVYEWSNYRLSAGLINAKKGEQTDVLDPFAIEPGWFALELVGFQVLQGPSAPADRIADIASTIENLGLNRRDCCRAREEYVVCYEQGRIDLEYLERRAPFVASELRRQGRLRQEDL
jgi:hypothetical protein